MLAAIAIFDLNINLLKLRGAHSCHLSTDVKFFSKIVLLSCKKEQNFLNRKIAKQASKYS